MFNKRKSWMVKITKLANKKIFTKRFGFLILIVITVVILTSGCLWSKRIDVEIQKPKAVPLIKMHTTEEEIDLIFKVKAINKKGNHLSGCEYIIEKNGEEISTGRGFGTSTEKIVKEKIKLSMGKNKIKVKVEMAPYDDYKDKDEVVVFKETISQHNNRILKWTIGLYIFFLILGSIIGYTSKTDFLEILVGVSILYVISISIYFVLGGYFHYISFDVISGTYKIIYSILITILIIIPLLYSLYLEINPCLKKYRDATIYISKLETKILEAKNKGVITKKGEMFLIEAKSHMRWK